jgi:hypothetical protein
MHLVLGTDMVMVTCVRLRNSEPHFEATDDLKCLFRMYRPQPPPRDQSRQKDFEKVPKWPANHFLCNVVQRI